LKGGYEGEEGARSKDNGSVYTKRTVSHCNKEDGRSKG